MTAASDMAGGGLGCVDRARADRQATEWLILLQEEPEDGALLGRFDTWLAASTVNAEAWAETGHVSRVITATPPAHVDNWMDLTGARLAPVVPIEAARSRAMRLRQPLRRRVIELAALATAACLLLLASPNLLVRTRADHIAGTGEMETVRLQDGSLVRLASGSAMTVNYGDGARRVRLLLGDAYFDVVHDPAHPFEVSADQTRTMVLGTAFEVRRTGDATAVAVRRGLVRVDCGDDARAPAQLLAVGQTVNFACNGKAERGVIQPTRIAPWVNGQLLASDRPMREVIDAIRPWYGGVIMTFGAGIDKLRVTGVYDLHNPADALTALAEAHHLQVRRISPWLIVISAG